MRCGRSLLVVTGRCQPVYEVRVGERVAQVAEGNLAGMLRELVTAMLAEARDDG